MKISYDYMNSFLVYNGKQGPPPMMVSIVKSFRAMTTGQAGCSPQSHLCYVMPGPLEWEARLLGQWWGMAGEGRVHQSFYQHQNKCSSVRLAPAIRLLD